MVFKCVFMILPNIQDGAFFVKTVNLKKSLTTLGPSA